MEFKINTKELDKVLSNLVSIIPSKSPLEITQHVLLNLKDNLLTIKATDLQVSYQKTIPVFSDGEISVAIPGKLFHDTISSLPDTDIKVTFQQNEKKFVINTDTGKYVISYVDSSEFPVFPEVEELSSFTMNSERLKYALSTTSFACGKDEQRLAMRGILLDLKKDKVVFVSTDGHRLVKLDFNDFQSNFEGQLIIPSKSAELLERVLNDEEVRVIVGDKLVKFEIDGGIFVTRLIDDNYPNYESVIPLENDIVMQISRNELLKVLKRANNFVQSQIKRVDFEITKDMLSVTAENDEMGTKMDEKMLCSYSNDPLKISFKLDLISDILEHIKEDELLFKFNSPTRPCLIEPANQKENENLLVILMPMRVNV